MEAGAEADKDAQDFVLLSEFARRRNEIDPFLLRGLLANTLRARGWGAIVWSDDGVQTAEPSRFASRVLPVILVWSLGISLTSGLGLHWLWAPAVLVTVFLAIAGFVYVTDSSTAGGALILLLWIVVGLIEAVEGPFLTFTVAYLTPLGFALAYGLANRVLRLRDAQDVALALAGVIKGAPLVAPVVLIVLFLPALSSDVWQIAGGLTPGTLLIVGILSVGLLFVVVRLQLGSQLKPMLSQRAKHLSDLGTRAPLTRAHLEATTDESGAAVLEGITDARLEASWPVAGEEYAPYLQAAVGSTLQAPLTGRLAVTVGVIGLLFSAYIYVLCAAVVPVETAAQWSGVSAPSRDIELLGAGVSVVGGPYLNLAALLGLAATATFLSFALVEARFATALTDALLRDPTDRYLVLALPYVSLWEDAIEAGRRRQVETDPESPPPALAA